MTYDRHLTKRLLAAATGWREAARVILSANAQDIVLWPPFYTSLYYALEQSFKAFMASRGATRKELRLIGHSLNELRADSEKAGLQSGTDRFSEFLVQLDGKLLELRYLEGEEIEIAEPSEALQLVDEHFISIGRSIPVRELLETGDAARI